MVDIYTIGHSNYSMERFVEILSAVPFMIGITLLKYHMKGSSHLFILFIIITYMQFLFNKKVCLAYLF